MTKSRWINTRVAIDMATGAVLEREGFFYVGPLALAEGVVTPEQLAAATAAADAANKAKDEAIAEAAKLRKDVADMKGRVLSDEDKKKFDELLQAQALAEENKKRAAGEFDKLREDLVAKHETEKTQLVESNRTLAQRFKDTVVRAEFGSATELFGGDTAKTILDPEMGRKVLGDYVQVEDLEDGGYRVVVKNPAGNVIVGKDGKPAAFKDALTELIGVLPNKDRILRGSGKTGSGSSGGAGGGSGEPDLAELTKRANSGDKDALAKLKQQQAGLGGIQMGAGV